MSGHVLWLKELNEESYYLMDKRIVIEQPAFESISDYTRSQPTGPSPGRIYRKNLGWPGSMPDNWFVYIVADDPEDAKWQLHHPHRVELVPAGDQS